MREIVRLYELPENFEINSFQNWVPCHPSCNRRKTDFVFDASPALILAFKVVLMHARFAELVAEEIEKDNRKAIVLAKLQRAAETGLVTKKDVMDLFEKLPIIVRRSATQFVEELILSNEWKVIFRDLDIEVLPLKSQGDIA